MNLKTLLPLIKKDSDIIIQEIVEDSKKGLFGQGKTKEKEHEIQGKIKAEDASENLSEELYSREIALIEFNFLKRSFVITVR